MYLHLTGLREERLELVLGGSESKVACKDLLGIIVGLGGLDVVCDGVDNALVRVRHIDRRLCVRMKT